MLRTSPFGERSSSSAEDIQSVYSMQTIFKGIKKKENDRDWLTDRQTRTYIYKIRTVMIERKKDGEVVRIVKGNYVLTHIQNHIVN